jgi:hypothetical protein
MAVVKKALGASGLAGKDCGSGPSDFEAGVDKKFVRCLGTELEHMKQGGGPGCDGEDTT